MFARLRGKAEIISENQVILDVNGVGYLVYCSSNTINTCLPDEEIILQIETFVREDAINLFGFVSEVEKYWFIQLNKVNGVGPKLALTILSSASINALEIAIASKDKAIFKSISGVGPKLADRIITELKNVKPLSLSENIISIKKGGSDNSKISDTGNNKQNEDAMLALEKLGFSRADAFVTVNKIISENPETKLQDIIKEGLKQLSKIA